VAPPPKWDTSVADAAARRPDYLVQRPSVVDHPLRQGGTTKFTGPAVARCPAPAGGRRRYGVRWRSTSARAFTSTGKDLAFAAELEHLRGKALETREDPEKGGLVESLSQSREMLARWLYRQVCQPLSVCGPQVSVHEDRVPMGVSCAFTLCARHRPAGDRLDTHRQPGLT
jgi:hypothetical protein